MPVTVSLVFDRRKPLKKTNTYPFKLRVTSERRPIEYRTQYSLSEKDYVKLKSPRVNDSLRKIRESLEALISAARLFIHHMGKFSFYEFERDFINRYEGCKKRTLSEEFIKDDSVEFDFSPYMERFKYILQEQHPGKDYISYTYAWYVRKLIMQQRIGSALNYLYSYS